MLNLMKELGRLPGIGERSAERLACHILRGDAAEALALAQAIRDVKEKIRQCSVCYNMSETDPCEICADNGRDHSLVCVVEETKDLLALERAGSYRGSYHVLGGRIAPLEGLDPGKLTVKPLVERAKSGKVKEVILALNPNMEGDLTAHYLHDELKMLGVRVTQIARGIPSGSQIEYANQAIIADALKGRREM
jgi:recombination protein RecR